MSFTKNMYDSTGCFNKWTQLFFFSNHRNVPDTCLGVEIVKIRESTFENNEISSFLSLAYQVQPIPEKKKKMLNWLTTV